MPRRPPHVNDFHSTSSLPTCKKIKLKKRALRIILPSNCTTYTDVLRKKRKKTLQIAFLEDQKKSNRKNRLHLYICEILRSAACVHTNTNTLTHIHVYVYID